MLNPNERRRTAFVVDAKTSQCLVGFLDVDMLGSVHGPAFLRPRRCFVVEWPHPVAPTVLIPALRFMVGVPYVPTSLQGSFWKQVEPAPGRVVEDFELAEVGRTP